MKSWLFAVILAGGVLLFSLSAALAAPEEGLLIDEKGDVIPGYSTVIVDDGLAYPVRNLESDTWYCVIVTGTADDGTILCTVGEPMEAIPEGVAIDESGSDEEEVDDDDDRPGEGK